MNEYPELQLARGLRNGLLIAIPFWIVLFLAATKLHAQDISVRDVVRGLDSDILGTSFPSSKIASAEASTASTYGLNSFSDLQAAPLSSISAIPSSEWGLSGAQGSTVQPRTVGTMRALSFYIAAASADTAYSLYLFHAKQAREAGLGRGMEQQPAKFVATKATVLTGTVLVLRVMEQKYPKLAKWTTYGFLGWESAILVHNYTVTR